MEEYLRTLTGFYPVSSDAAAVSRLLAYVQQHGEKAGLHCERLEHNGVHSLYASSTGKKHVRLLLQGHIDVVPGKDQPFRTTEDSYDGRGTYDMLFATACFMRLLDELSSQISILDLGIMLSGDEELGGFNGVKPFLDAGYGADICLLPDAGEGFGTLSIGAKGIQNYRVLIHGKAHHGSRPWEGDGAAAKLVHFLADAEALFDTSDRYNSTMTIAQIHAGDAMNRGPATAEAVLDIRYKDKPDLARIRQGIEALLKQYYGEIISTLEGENFALDTSNTYVKSFLELYEASAGKPITFVRAHGSSDARFFAEHNIPVIMLRPDGGGAHGDNEWVSRESVEQFYKLLKEYVIQTATIGSKQ